MNKRRLKSSLLLSVPLFAGFAAYAGEAPTPPKDPAQAALWQKLQSDDAAQMMTAFHALYQKIGAGMSKTEVKKLFPPDFLVEKPGERGESFLFLREDLRKKIGEKYNFFVLFSADGFVKRKVLIARDDQ